MSKGLHDASTPQITDSIIKEIAEYDAEHIGGGVVRFSGVSFIPDYIFPWIQQAAQEAHEQRWTYETDENGVTYALNEDLNKFDLEQVKLVPTRVLDPVTESTPSEITETLNYWEDMIYKCLIRYVDFFPMVLGTLWWRNRGHILRYKEGNFLGTHNDNDANYRSTNGTKYVPQVQSASRQTLAVLLYLNDGVQHPDKLDGTNYTGGEMNFPYLDINYQGKTGDIIIFPCNFLATHGVNTVTAGDRYTYLEFFSQGSPQPEVGVNVVEPDAIDSWCPPHWLNNIYDDYAKYAKHSEIGANKNVTDRTNPVFQNRTLEGKEGLSKGYDHGDVVDINYQRNLST
jgi:hypothetical protein